jgi:hypothetical protein
MGKKCGCKSEKKCHDDCKFEGHRIEIPKDQKTVEKWLVVKEIVHKYHIEELGCHKVKSCGCGKSHGHGDY